MHIVIVGNGVAGMEAARGLRARGFRDRITMVSEESDHHFSRPALMWVHSGQLSHADIEPWGRDAYERFDLQRVRSRAIALRAKRRELVLGGDDGTLAYDRLLIACGSRSRSPSLPGEGLRGVGYFVTLQDLAWYEEELWGTPSSPGPVRPHAHVHASDATSAYTPRMPASRAKGRVANTVAVIGGGLIGSEAAELALERGKRVHFWLRDGWFWPMALVAEEAAFVATRFSEHGAELHMNRSVQRLLDDGDGNVGAVESDGESVPCDAVVLATGVEANTDWLRESGLRLTSRGAIWVDRHLRTNLPGVYAAGDCAAVDQGAGEPRPEPLWYVARDQGRVAASGLCGQHADFDLGIPYNSAKLMDVEYTSVGQVAPVFEGVQQLWFAERGPVKSTIRVAVRERTVIGLSLLGRRWEHDILRKFIADGGPVEQLPAAMRDACFDTEFTPPLRLSLADFRPLGPPKR